MKQKVLIDKKIYIKTFETALKEKKWTLAEFSDRTKLQESTLKKILSADFSGFKKIQISSYIRIICNELGLKADHFILFAESQTDYIEELQILYPKKLNEKQKQISVLKIIGEILFGIFIVGVSIFIGLQIKSFASKPKIEIISPQENEVVRKEIIKITGKTCEKCTLSINGKNTEVGKSGEFERVIKLVSGKNIILISTESELGRKNEKKILIFYEP
ncbi:MAG: hypothetical protein Fur0024_5110 [Patescibacteria group bacterium]